MAIKDSDRSNFETLLRAAQNGDLALVECQDKATDEYRAVICAVGYEDGEYVMTPFGHLVTQNPFDIYVPPV
jgi:hypothetical protein